MFLQGNLFGKRKDEEKEKQIKDLKINFPSIRRPDNDDAIFEIVFEVNRCYSALRIYIMPDFPTSKPG